MKKSFLAIILVLFSATSFGQTEIDVLVDCAPAKHPDFVFKSSDFLYFLNADGALGEGGARLVSKAPLPKTITMHGSSSSYGTKNLHIFKLSIVRLQAYLDLRNSKGNPFPELKTPQNLGDVLQEFQEMTTAGCDFLTPTRFYSMLKPSKTEVKEPHFTKIQDELAMCKEQLEACTSSGPAVINSLNRDSKETVDQVDVRTDNKAKALRQ